MALIKCPNCGEEISDKAQKCPKCGYVLEKKTITKVCEECGTELENGAKICPKCGCPVPLSDEEKKKKKKKKTILIITSIIMVILLIIVVVCIRGVLEKKQEEKAAAAEKEAMIEASNEYSANLTLASISMLSGASTAEEAGTLIHDVWYNTIFDKYDESTSKYTSGNSDFNDSLAELFEDQEFKNKIDSIKENQDTVKDFMQKLTNPPSEYEKAYEAINEYYDAYLELTNLVTNPTGNLQSYTDAFNEADSNVAKCYQAMDIYLE